MKIQVRYFAILRDVSGCSQETVETTASTPQELYNELAGKHGFTLPPSVVKAAVGTEFASMDAPLKDGDEVTFIPPVAGG